MSPQNANTLLTGVPPDRFVGRRQEFERVYAAAVTGIPARGIRLSAAAGVGASELLRQVYDRLFTDQRFCVPFYFALEPGDESATSAATRYLYQFLLQAVAFRRGEPDLLLTQPDIGDLSRLAPPADADWVDGVREILERGGPLQNERAFIRTALAAPLRAAVNGVRVFPIVDDLHRSVKMADDRRFVDELVSIFSVSKAPYVFSAAKGFVIRGDGFEQLNVEPLSREEMSEVVASQGAEADVELSDHARDLIAVQTGSRPGRSQALIDAARSRRRRLESFRDVEQVYAEELVGGRLGQELDEKLLETASDADTVRRLVEALHFSIEPASSRFSLSALRERLDVDVDRFNRLIEALAVDGFVVLEAGLGRLEEDALIADLIDSRYRLTRSGTTTASVQAHIVTKAIGRAPLLMENVYRSEAGLDLEELLLSFDLQEIPMGLLDYRAFRENYKGLPESEVLERLSRDDQTVPLPQMSHVAELLEHLSSPGFAGADRVVVGVGFTDRAYRPDDRTVWLVAEIESKLEAEADAAESWLTKLSGAASPLGYKNYRVWLIAPEGFTNEALDVLEARDAMGSSRRQVELLREFLNPHAANISVDAKEYEMVIPAGDDAELISAHSLEEIARRHDFPAKAVNQIKTALVEACINASEHGLSPDRKIYQKFAVDDEKIVITISNRGIRMRPNNQNSNEGDASERTGRRGWGLELIRRLMDDVRVEQVDDGTRILMTKYLRAGAA